MINELQFTSVLQANKTVKWRVTGEWLQVGAEWKKEDDEW